MKHLTCCDKPLRLQCYGHCGKILLNIRAYQTGIHYIRFVLNNIQWNLKLSAQAGEFISFKNNLPEYGEIIFTILQPDKKVLTHKHLDTSTASICDYKMFILETRPKFIVSDDAIDINSLLCLNECKKYDDINLLCN